MKNIFVQEDPIKLAFEPKSKAKFYVNFDKKTGRKTVTAVIKSTWRHNGLKKHGVEYSGIYGNVDKEIIGKGVAYLADGDTFDIEKGKKVAFAKAENNAYKKAAKITMDYFNMWKELMVLYKPFYEKAINCCMCNNDYIRRISE